MRSVTLYKTKNNQGHREKEKIGEKMKETTAHKRVQYICVCPYCDSPDDIHFLGDHIEHIELESRVNKCWNCQQVYNVLNPDKIKEN